MVSVPLSESGGESTEGERRSFSKGRRREEPSFEALPDSIPPQNLTASLLRLNEMRNDIMQQSKSDDIARELHIIWEAHYNVTGLLLE